VLLLLLLLLQVYDILNSLEDRLGVTNSAVVLAAMKVRGGGVAVSWFAVVKGMSTHFGQNQQELLLATELTLAHSFPHHLLSQLPCLWLSGIGPVSG